MSEYTFEEHGFEVVEPVEPTVRVELTKSQLEAVLELVAGRGMLKGAWTTMRNASRAIGARR